MGWWDGLMHTLRIRGPRQPEDPREEARRLADARRRVVTLDMRADNMMRPKPKPKHAAPHAPR